MNDNPKPGSWFDTNATKSAEDKQAQSDKAKEQLEALGEDAKQQAEKFGEAARKFAQDAGYAAAGFAGLVGDKAKAFYEEQKQQYAETHPDQDKDPGAKEFLEQLSDKLNKFVEDLAKGFRDLSERGRESWSSSTDDEQTAAQEDVTDVVGGQDLHEEPVENETPSGVTDDERNDL
ncbi:hypothetical protein GCM10028820_04720 [Tessaracoccus terricola]